MSDIEPRILKKVVESLSETSTSYSKTIPCKTMITDILKRVRSIMFPNYFRNTAAQAATGVVGVIVTLVLAGFTVKLSRKFGRKELAIFGSLLGAVVYAAAFFVQTQNQCFHFLLLNQFLIFVI